MKEQLLSQQIDQSPFFTEYSKQLKTIAQNSRLEQDKLRQVKKIQSLRDKKERQLPEKYQKILDNIVIDYLRSLNLNYSYSIVMRERNLISQQITTKQSLVDLLHLNSIYSQSSQFNISILQLLLMNHSDYLQNDKKLFQQGIQVDLIQGDKTVNNRLLNQIRIQQVRRQVQQSQKKHYKQMLSAVRQQLTTTIKDELKKEFDRKMKQLKESYEQQVTVMRQKNKEILVNSPKLNPRIEQYLHQIEQLENTNLNLSERVKELQKQKITHNCFSNQQITDRENELIKLTKEMEQKKKQYDLALRSIQTSVEDLAAQKMKLHEAPKQTDLFVNEMRKNKQNKDYMIQQIYGRMFVMDKRIKNILSDNESLMEENRTLSSKVKQLQNIRQELLAKKQSSPFLEQLKKYTVKPNTKDTIVNVTEQDIQQAFNNHKEHIIDQSISGIESDEQQQCLRKKAQYKNEVQSITSQMRLLKNKLRFMVQQFT